MRGQVGTSFSPRHSHPGKLPKPWSQVPGGGPAQHNPSGSGTASLQYSECLPMGKWEGTGGERKRNVTSRLWLFKSDHLENR